MPRGVPGGAGRIEAASNTAPPPGTAGVTACVAGAVDCAVTGRVPHIVAIATTVSPVRRTIHLMRIVMELYDVQPRHKAAGLIPTATGFRRHQQDHT